jgi:hypothetical protein
MCRIWLAACLALCACFGDFVRAPTQIPSDGVVECTDSMRTPVEIAAFGAAAVGGSVLYFRADPEGAVDSGGWLLAAALASSGLWALLTAPDAAREVHECREAKQRGAVVAGAARRKAAARAEAGEKWKRAAAAARADDCATVRELDPQIRALDVELHDVVFARDVAIARCLVATP